MVKVNVEVPERGQVVDISTDLPGKPAVALPSPGWCGRLSGGAAEPRASKQVDGLWELTAGASDGLDDRMVSGPMVRSAIEAVTHSYDVVIISVGSLQDRLSAQLVLSHSDVGVLAVTPSDKRAVVLGQIDRLDELPRQGSVAVMRNALPGDPWLALRT